MKKTVQIVTIPLDKEGWSKNDIVMMSGTIQFPIYAMESGIDDCQAQQLLVLSDDEIQEGDVKHSRNCEPFKKVIASYPQIEGTLSISKETVQAWIDAGTPKEGVVEETIDCQAYYGYGGHDCHRPCDCKMKYKTIEYPYSGDAYPENSLLLDFPTAVTDQDISNAAKKLGQTVDDIRSGKLVVEYAGRNVDKLPYPELLKEMVEYYKDVKIIQEKPAIPTDEEIEEKFKELYKDNRMDFKGLSTPLHPLFTAFLNYQYGYKQALKDLGYE